MKKKLEHSIEKALNLFNLGATVLISSGVQDNPNICTVSWITGISRRPPILVFSIGVNSHTYDLIKTYGEFVVNFPDQYLIETVHFCGINSGKNVDKFARTGVNALQSNTVSCPAVEECFAHLECAVVDTKAIDNQILVQGQILYAAADKGSFDNIVLIGNDIKTLHYIDDTKYMVGGKIINVHNK